MTATDTIVAVATAAGRGGVGIVRLSGPDAAAIAARIAGTLPAPRTAAYRRFRDRNGATLDSGLVLQFVAPQSFTGETVVEFQGHGSPQALQLLVAEACAHGARPARAGEFSERAFLNGRIDLAQAEAIADLIDASTAEAARAAQRSLDGEFSKRVHAAAERLIELRMFVEGALDFSDEDVDWLADRGLAERVAEARTALAELLVQAEQGRRLRDGYTVALTGQPNVGKSTLLNRLAGADVAIVTDIAGTTRDVLRENLDLRGLPVTLVDTAGLRDGGDAIEREGMRRARLALEQAELALFIVDARSGISAEDRMLIDALPAALPRLIVHNKADLASSTASLPGNDAVAISAATGAGIDALIAEIHRRAGLRVGEAGLFSARGRHLDALRRAQALLDAAAERLDERVLPELAAEDLRRALDALGEITGAFSSEDLLGRIFASFCIGK
ncbi:tRNA uridine-5-carboxymethylaminomethyl(34) synthesis GTPase MnmE [Solimonas marina]|uniref:tRNA modification GTPase MnmE n=1 Tax=Solimonas marina TaxID=2714601 RepID=A0A969W7T3_9GAMM|nr:tRNA uridine-5-carboxymethylaminomethyl(34) synthesis GTPase MnmE [Solimonas marina]NKF21145.1 tRNA uridine-5-carboxymethylaminomethyl(34) synthesis GTPase MnmE [Solimonas marina]